MKKVYLLAVAALSLAGCATRPESISASFVSHEKYIANDCMQLTTNMADARADLAKFSSMQNTKANVDAATVFLALVPVSKLSGDHAGDVAKYKGEVEAIETAQIKNGCKKLKT
jgi:starvation-inducible outer membrane lipoprotein